ncbi:MAG: energy transducer TonB [Paludibacteraceae bacterium]
MKRKSDIYASIGTLVVCGIVLLILLFCGMSASRDPIDEGLMVVSYGDMDDGQGVPEEPQAQPEETSPAAAAQQPAATPPNPTPQTEQPLMTQEDESVALAQAEQRRKEQEQARLLAEQRERERKAAEEARIAAEKAKKAAEQQAKADKANAMASVFGQKADKGSGTTTGETMQGNPVGSGTSNGHGWSLNGRSLQGGLPKPAYSTNEQGRIVVKIRVDRSGNVTEAIVDPTLSNITNKELRDASVAAAKKTRFTAGDNIVMGTITYNFSMK